MAADGRRFGVEIEMAHPLGCGGVRDLLQRRGYPHWAEQNIHPDGSGVELPSPILRGAKGFRELREIMALLVETGGSTTRSDGMHVHHDAPEFLGKEGVPNVVRLVKAWANNQYTNIDPFVGNVTRTDGATWCGKWAPQEVANLERQAHNVVFGSAPVRNVYGVKGRGALNIGALNKGTIEIRLHHGILDGEKAEAWVRFGQAFIRSVLKGNELLNVQPSPQELLKLIRPYPKAAKLLREVAAA